MKRFRLSALSVYFVKCLGHAWGYRSIITLDEVLLKVKRKAEKNREGQRGRMREAGRDLPGWEERQKESKQLVFNASTQPLWSH